MEPTARKTALRMIPYGLYVLTGEGSDGRIAASTVNWVTPCIISWATRSSDTTSAQNAICCNVRLHAAFGH